MELWGRLCDSLLSSDREDYRKLQKDIEKKYYNEQKAREHLESQFYILIKQNINFSCINFDDYINMTYLRNITPCMLIDKIRSNDNITNNKTQKPSVIVIRE